MESKAPKKSILQAFVEGANKGWKISTTSMMPNVMMAFMVIYILSLTGLLDVISTVFAPIMGVVKLPGAAATVYISALLSGVGAAGAASGLYLAGELSAANCAILFPAVVMMTGTVQYLGRILGATKISGKYYGICVAINVVLGFLAMFAMSLFVG
ncbi:MAG: hypothetical protein VB049_07445 [Candidatus Pelethousia sp.]|nr:hypothetical protein [Candidatus Pelethousia sp.]